MYKLIFLLITMNLILNATQSITPVPEHTKLNMQKVILGEELFFDTILSKNNTISCASCHNLAAGGDDNLKFSFGIKGKEGNINSPTVLNAVFNFRQFWDGRASNLQDQASGPIENPIEMGHSFKELIPILKNTPYKKKFALIYKEGVTKNSITDAIAEYEKSLITPNAPFDFYLKGDVNAITKEQKEGFKLFETKGCISCHHGINVGGNMYSKFGLFKDTKSSDLGRYNVTHKERDKYYFKVPSLRNIERTAPYFHDGRTYELREAVSEMAQFQLGRKITPQEIDKIVAFLKSLNGELPQRRIK